MTQQGQRYHQRDHAAAVLGDQVLQFGAFLTAQVLLEVAAQVLQHIAVSATGGRAAQGAHQLTEIAGGQLVQILLAEVAQQAAEGLLLLRVGGHQQVLVAGVEVDQALTADAIGLCLKSGNTVVLKGGSEALRSNTAIARVLAEAAEANGIPQGSVQFITSTDHEAVQELISLRGLIDVVIPRGGARLIHAVVENAKVPVIETGLGVCHTYVDAGADYDMAARIAINAKVQRPAVCNSMETLLVHKDAAKEFLPAMLRQLQEKGVTILGDESTRRLGENIQPATEEDWATEYDDLRLSVKVVDSLEEAIDHIARYGTRHSECIVTRSYEHARKFQHCVDAAAVYVNASTRFTDGFQYGFGAEIGISTQKLHTRGPMALPELTTFKYLINGDGQIRE